MSEMRLRRARAFAADYPNLVRMTDRALYVLRIIQSDVDPHSFTPEEIFEEYEVRTAGVEPGIKHHNPLDVEFAKLAAAGFIEKTGNDNWELTPQGEEFTPPRKVRAEDERGDERGDEDPPLPHLSFRDVSDMRGES